MQRSSHGWVYVSAEDITAPPVAGPSQRSQRSSDSSSSTDSERGDVENYASMKVKVFSTILAYVLMMGMSFTYSILGPCLLDIASLYSIPSDTAATLFLWQGIGGLVGSLLFGKLYDILRESVILVPNLFLGAVVTAAIPWAQFYGVLAILFGLQGLSMSSLTLGSHMLLLRYWGSKNGPFLQALHLMYPIAALIAPQVARPFLMETRNIANITNNSGEGNITWSTRPDYSVKVTNNSINSSVSWSLLLYNENTQIPSTSSILHNGSSTTIEPSMEPGVPVINTSQIYYVYIINAGILVFLALISLIPFCYEPHVARSNQVDNAPEQEKPSFRKRVFEKFIWIIFFISAVFLGCLEITFSGLLFTFVVEYLNWSKSNGTLLLTISSACYALGRLLGIFAATFLKAKIILGFDYILMLASLFCLTILVHLHPVVVWVCCSLCMFGVATVFASNLTWARDFFHVTGVFTSLYLVGYSTGLLAGPALVGHLFKHLHALWFCYMLIMFAGSIACLYTVLLLSSCFINICHKRKTPDLDISEMKGMIDPEPLENNSIQVTENK